MPPTAISVTIAVTVPISAPIPFVAFALALFTFLMSLFTLTVGSWYLANVLGGIFGGNFGYNWGRNVRNKMWATWVREREAGLTADTEAGVPAATG